MSVTLIDGGSMPPMGIPAISRTLGISIPVVHKGLETGIIPNCNIESIAMVANRPIITAAFSATGVSIPVLRLGVLEPDVSTDPRGWIGYDTEMHPEDLLAAALRWWTDPGRNMVLAAKCYLVACASVVVALVELDTSQVAVNPTSGRIAYHGHLVGYRDPEGNTVILDEKSPNVAAARSAIGARALGGRGGNFTSI